MEFLIYTVTEVFILSYPCKIADYYCVDSVSFTIIGDAACYLVKVIPDRVVLLDVKPAYMVG